MIKLSSRLKSFFLFIIVFLGISSFLLFGNRLFANSEADSESSLAFLPIVMNNADGSHKPTPNSTSTSTATTTATATITSTPTTNATATFTPLATTTATTTNTPGRPYITLQPNCANGPDPQFVVFGFNWPPDEDIGLFWDNDILMIIDANQHNGAFSRVITIHSVTDGTYTVKAISENLIEDTAVFTVPCDLPPTPTNPATSTPTHTSTPSFESCPVRFEGNAVAGNDFVSVTGDVGTTVTIINVDTGVPLGSTTLIAHDGHFCAGFADFQEPLHNPLIEQLQQGHLLVASSDDGSNDETFVIGQTATATPTNTHTPTPSSTPTHTPSNPYIALQPNCGAGPDVQFIIFGFNWPPNEDILLRWETDLLMIIDANQHSGAFSRVVTIPSVTAGTYTVKAISENLTEDTAAFNVPCDIPPTPTPPTATPTSTPRPADLVMISPPQLLSAPPINAYESVDFRVVITNTGDIDINQQFFVDLYFDPTAIFSTYIPITESVGLAAVSGLPSGESRVITITAPTGFKNIPDPHMVYSMVDSVNVPGGQIAEANETNNVSNPATIYNVIPAGTPTATPTPDPSGADSISGIVQSRVTQWIPQNRAIVYLVDSLSQIITVQQTDENGFYSFNNVQPDQYTVYSCIDIEGIGYFGIRTGVVPPNPFANIYMLPGSCTFNPSPNILPVVTNPGNQVNDIGDIVSLPIVATDSDGPSALSYSATGLPSSLTINSDTGVISGTLSDSSQGTYNVTVNVYDGAGTASIFFTWTVSGLKLETVTANNVNSSEWTTMSLANSYNSVVAVCTVVYANNTIPEVVRMQNAAGNSFQIKLQNPSNQVLNGETVHCLVMEEGVWEMNGRKLEAQKYTSTVTDHKNSWSGQAQIYGQSYTNPIVLGQVMTTNDAGWSTFWSRGTSRTNPPNNTTLFTGKHVGEDSVITRSNETIGFIVIEAGAGTIDGVNYQTYLGPDTVRGIDNGTFTYTFPTAFSSIPEVAILSNAGMDGNEGGWAILLFATPLTTTTVTLSNDQDQINDTERLHTNEQVGYIVFESQIILDGTE